MSPITQTGPLLSIPVPFYLEMSRNIQDCPGISRNVPEYPGLSRNIQDCPGISRNVPEYPGMSRNPRRCPGISRNVPESLEEVSRRGFCLGSVAGACSGTCTAPYFGNSTVTSRAGLFPTLVSVWVKPPGIHLTSPALRLLVTGPLSSMSLRSSRSLTATTRWGPS